MLPTLRRATPIVALLAAASLAVVAAPRAEDAAGGAKASGAKAGGDVAVQTLKNFIAQQKIDTKAPDWKTRLPKPPKATFDPAHTYYWNLETNVGSVKVKLMPKVAP